MPLNVVGNPSPESIEFGRLLEGRGIPAQKLCYGGERHALLFGVNGSGKDTRILLPNLLNMHGARSFVVVDPKGELAGVSAPWRRTVSNVVILNPFGVLTEYQGYDDMKGVGHNPLVSLNPAAPSFDRDASALAEAMVPLGETKDPHWNLSARALLTFIIMYVVIEAKGNRTTPTIARVRELLCQASEEPKPPSTSMPRGYPGKGIPVLAAEAMHLPIPGLRNKAAQFTTWSREIQSIVSTARIQTESFDDPEISECLSRDDFDWRDLKRKPTTVYLVIPPDSMERHGKWLRLMLTSALQASLRPHHHGEPKILFVLNEMAGLGHLSIIENTWSQVRGYGIQMLPVFQDISQIKTLYKDRWQTFVANAGIIASFAPNDSETAEWLSKRLGETTTMKTGTNYNKSRNKGTNHSFSGNNESQGESDGESESFTSSDSAEKTPFVTPDKLFSMMPGQLVIITAGQKNGAQAFATPYFRIDSRKARARPNPYYDNVPRRLPSPDGSSVPSWWEMLGGAKPDVSDNSWLNGFFTEPGSGFGKPFSLWGSGFTSSGDDWESDGTDPGWGTDPPSPAPKPEPAVDPASRHPAYPRKAEKPSSGVGKYASRHPGYTPDPPERER